MTSIRCIGKCRSLNDCRYHNKSCRNTKRRTMTWIVARVFQECPLSSIWVLTVQVLRNRSESFVIITANSYSSIMTVLYLLARLHAGKISTTSTSRIYLASNWGIYSGVTTGSRSIRWLFMIWLLNWSISWRWRTMLDTYWMSSGWTQWCLARVRFWTWRKWIVNMKTVFKVAHCTSSISRTWRRTSILKQAVFSRRNGLTAPSTWPTFSRVWADSSRCVRIHATTSKWSATWSFPCHSRTICQISKYHHK